MKAIPTLPQGVESLVHGAVDKEAIVAITDKHGEIAYANDRFCEISGYSRQELLGSNHRILKSGMHPSSFYRELWATILGGRSWKGEICNRAKDGHLYWVETTIVPLHVDGLITHFVALRTDITAKKELEQTLKLRSQKQETERRMLALGHLADGVLHDLNNILTGMLGLSQEANSEQRNIMLQSSVNQMIKLTRMLRDYSTGSSSDRTRFRVNPLVLCAAALVRYRKGVPRSLKVEDCMMETKEAEVEGVEAHVFEVLLNLCVNAIEALSSTPEPRLRFRSQVKEDGFILFVEDNGPGIKAGLESSLFDSGVSSKGTGRGLGLSVAKQLARSLGGDLTLERAGGTRAGEGACFRLELPLAPSIPRQEPEVIGCRPSILVSEDDFIVRRIIETVADRAGFTVAYPASSQAVIAAAQALGPRLVAVVLDSCDEESEEGDVAQLRRLNPGLPILLISANQTRKGRHASRWGEVFKLPKPFDTVELSQAIKTSVNQNATVPLFQELRPDGL